MGIGLMSYDQIIRLMRDFANDLEIEIDLFDYTTKDDFIALYQQFEQALASKVDTETYTATMTQIEDAMADMKSNLDHILPIDLSSGEQVTNTLDIYHGGTSATTAEEAQYNLLNDLTVKVTDLDDTDYIVYSKPDQSAENGSVGKMRVSHMWNWVKDKIEDEAVIPTINAISKKDIDSIF